MPPLLRRPRLPLPTPGHRRATVVGAGSFGTAVAVLLVRAGLVAASTEEALAKAIR
jgi:hypothetical protein